jgi:hypothetical protein
VDQSTLQALMGPYGVIGLLFTGAAGLTRAVIYLHRKREEDRQALMQLIDSLHSYHMEAQRLVGRAVAVLERVEGRLRGD